MNCIHLSFPHAFAALYESEVITYLKKWYTFTCEKVVLPKSSHTDFIIMYEDPRCAQALTRWMKLLVQLNPDLSCS
jgi:hypothetical protein